MGPESTHLVLLYYLYAKIDDPNLYRDQHRALCERLNLKGRIIIAEEGINGTVSGLRADCEAYMEALKADALTQNIEWKVDPANEHRFPRLSIKARKEIVSLNLGEEDLDPNEATGKHLSPEEWQAAMKDPNAVILDARNDYEWEMGHFEGAILPDIESFRELPQWVRDNREKLEGKKILTYCTGGIRCEKFSSFLVHEGFEDVNQLHGGVVMYSKNEQTQGDQFKGQLYVFDDRVGVEVNFTDNACTLGVDIHTNEACKRFVNCDYKPCNKQFFLSEESELKYGRFCEPRCKKAYELHGPHGCKGWVKGKDDIYQGVNEDCCE